MNESVLSLIKDQLTDLFKSYDQFQGMYRNSVITLFSKFLSKEDIKEFPENTTVNIKGRRFEISSSFINPDKKIILSGKIKCSGSCCESDYSPIEIELEKLDTSDIIEVAKILLPII